MNQVDQLKKNIAELAQQENKTELEIVNELLAGAAKCNHEAVIEILLDIRQPMIQAQLDAIHAR